MERSLPSPSLDLPPRQEDRLTDRLLARAAWFSAPRKVELKEEEVPSPGDDQVLVRAFRSAISHGTEMLVYRGQVEPDLVLDLPTLRGSFRFPIKYGYATVGRVESVGDSVERLTAGQLVFVHHPHQSAFLVPQDAAVPLPPDIDPEVGAFLANLETAVNIVLDARPEAGQTVVVFGQGVVGLLVTQLLRRAGVGMVVAIEPVARRRELATVVGADHTLEPGRTVLEAVTELTNGSGADLAIEVSGNPAALDQAIQCVRLNGTVVAASWYGTKPVTLQLGGAFHRNRVRIHSSQVSHLDPALGPEWTRERRMQLALDHLGDISCAPLISHRFPLEQVAEAYRLIDEHPDEVVQVLFTYV